MLNPNRDFTIDQVKTLWSLRPRGGRRAYGEPHVLAAADAIGGTLLVGYDSTTRIPAIVQKADEVFAVDLEGGHPFVVLVGHEKNGRFIPIA